MLTTEVRAIELFASLQNHFTDETFEACGLEQGYNDQQRQQPPIRGIQQFTQFDNAALIRVRRSVEIVPITPKIGEIEIKRYCLPKSPDISNRVNALL